MKEIEDIVKAYDEAELAGKKAALATVVHVQGSSFRRPGARMLVTEEGRLTGAISGGCLEGDALRKALLAISEGRNKLVTYDTTDEDDASFGVQLGCNGIVYILFEPINRADPNHPVALLKKMMLHRRDAVLVTLFSLTKAATPDAGTSILVSGNDVELSCRFNNWSALPEVLVSDVHQVMNSKVSLIKAYNSQVLSNAFIDYIKPPVSLVIFGGGNDVMPLCEAAYILGWHTTIIDGRSSHATAQRFPKANDVVVARAETALTGLMPDERTVFVLMTHNYNYDLAVLRQLLQKQIIYTGVLGPKQKLQRMLAEIYEQGIQVNETSLDNLYGPVGLDIGAETAEEIAISVVSEIKAVLEGRKGQSLKEKNTPIHSGQDEAINSIRHLNKKMD